MVDSADRIENPDYRKALSLVEHLAELRGRAIRSSIYVAAGTMVGWCFYVRIFTLLSAPVSAYLVKNGGSFLITGVMEGFLIKMQISVLVGLILSVPFITGECWKFVSPGLTVKERRGVGLVAPLSMVLFLLGVVLAYFILPAGINWLAAQNPPDAKFMPSVQQTIIFILKMCLAFGLAFQLPVILIFLARIGIVNSKMLKAYWRHSVVGISVIAAVVTPSNDAFSMIMMFIAMVALYFGSIWLVRMFERR